MCSSIREFGFEIPVVARSDGEVVDGHLRLKAARKLGSWPGGDTTQIPVILCDEWIPQQVKAFRLMVRGGTPPCSVVASHRRVRPDCGPTAHARLSVNIRTDSDSGVKTKSKKGVKSDFERR
jgi:hypothetical protein